MRWIISAPEMCWVKYRQLWSLRGRERDREYLFRPDFIVLIHPICGFFSQSTLKFPGRKYLISHGALQKCVVLEELQHTYGMVGKESRFESNWKCTKGSGTPTLSKFEETQNFTQAKETSRFWLVANWGMKATLNLSAKSDALMYSSDWVPR